MNKVFVLPAKEDWIVDRFASEWHLDNLDISTKDPINANIIWLLASWCWNHLPYDLLRTKKVVTTVHHVVPEKFDLQTFLARDSITHIYHVYNLQTKNFIKNYTKKNVIVIPYWANQKIWYRTGSKLDLRKKYNLPLEDFLIGSFQRDTEGKDLSSPKLEKGPDLLADFIKKVSERKKVHVVLGGWRRQYIISRLAAGNIDYTYFEKPKHEVINDLYQTLDLYPVAARHEGGPQSLIECGLLEVPVVSRDVGIANQVLQKESINNDISLAIPSIPNVEDWKLPNGYRLYIDLFNSL